MTQTCFALNCTPAVSQHSTLATQDDSGWINKIWASSSSSLHEGGVLEGFSELVLSPSACLRIPGSKRKPWHQLELQLWTSHLLQSKLMGVGLQSVVRG